MYHNGDKKYIFYYSTIKIGKLNDKRGQKENVRGNCHTKSYNLLI